MMSSSFQRPTAFLRCAAVLFLGALLVSTMRPAAAAPTAAPILLIVNFGDLRVWAEGTLDYERAKGVPIWTAGQWLRFTETRHDAQSQDVAWDQASGQISFTLSTTATSDMLSVLLPPTFATRKLESVQVDGAAAEPTDFAVAGRTLALISVKTAKHTFAVRCPSPQATPAAVATVQPAAPTGVSGGAASAALATPVVPVVPPGMLAITGAMLVVVAAVAFLVRRGRSDRR